MKLDELFNAHPVFETERLVLRKLVASDAEEYYAFASDPEVAAQTTWAKHETLRDSEEFLTRVEERVALRQAYHWGIRLKSNGKLIGRTGIIHIDDVHDKAEIGYALSRDYWNQGIVTEATRPIIKYMLEEIEMNRLEARCNDSNPGSYRVMEKLGMSFEGLMRKQLRIKGSFVDQRLYAILRSDHIGDAVHEEDAHG